MDTRLNAGSDRDVTANVAVQRQAALKDELIAVAISAPAPHHSVYGRIDSARRDRACAASELAQGDDPIFLNINLTKGRRVLARRPGECSKMASSQKALGVRDELTAG